MWRCESDYPRGARLPGGENVISALHGGVQSVYEAISQNAKKPAEEIALYRSLVRSHQLILLLRLVAGADFLGPLMR